MWWGGWYFTLGAFWNVWLDRLWGLSSPLGSCTRDWARLCAHPPGLVWQGLAAGRKVPYSSISVFDRKIKFVEKRFYTIYVYLHKTTYLDLSSVNYKLFNTSKGRLKNLTTKNLNLVDTGTVFISQFVMHHPTTRLTVRHSDETKKPSWHLFLR